jgi:hypothetical protein
VGLEFSGDAVEVTLGADVLFAFDSPELAPEAAPRLDGLARPDPAEAGRALDPGGSTSGPWTRMAKYSTSSPSPTERAGISR